MGIEEDRIRLEWISAAEADKLRDVMNDMVARVTALGPLRLEVPAEAIAGDSVGEIAGAVELQEVTA
jgi:hypothetical protein